MSTSKKTPLAQPNLESLDDRIVPSVATAVLRGDVLTVMTNNQPSNVRVYETSTSIKVTDFTNGFTKYFPKANVCLLKFIGGASDDTLISYVKWLDIHAWGQAGNDHLVSYKGDDQLFGGPGMDILKSWGGNDKLYGNDGNDLLLGMSGNDQLFGGPGNDRLNGGSEADSMWGGLHNDVLIGIDNYTHDWMQGDAGRDIIWRDRNGSAVDTVSGIEVYDSVQSISGFANGADRILDNDRIGDPTPKAGAVNKPVTGKPLFALTGPDIWDIRQGQLGDCYLLAALGAIVNDRSFAIREHIVSFDDGTYGIWLGSNYYREDNDLPINSAGNLAYAQLGEGGSLWVALLEKAYCHYRYGANSYSSIEGGIGYEVNLAFGSTTAGYKPIRNFSSAGELANTIYVRWNNYEAVTINFNTIRDGLPLVANHAYTVYSILRNAAGAVISITLRNPWGKDNRGPDDGDGGLITLGPAQIFRCDGTVCWGKV